MVLDGERGTRRKLTEAVTLADLLTIAEKALVERRRATGMMNQLLHVSHGALRVRVTKHHEEAARAVPDGQGAGALVVPRRSQLLAGGDEHFAVTLGSGPRLEPCVARASASFDGRGSPLR